MHHSMLVVMCALHCMDARVGHVQGMCRADVHGKLIRLATGPQLAPATPPGRLVLCDCPWIVCVTSVPK